MNEINKDYLGMSDDDFLKVNGPSEDVTDDTNQPAAETNGNEPPVDPAADPDGNEANATITGGDGTTGDPSAPKEGEEEPKKPDEPPVGQPASAANNGNGEPTKPSASPEPKPGDKPADKAGEKPGSAEAEAAKPIDYKAFYDGLIGKPIRANGKEITLRSPEEVERFVQMGAGYGRKLQELQPHLKTLRMLEKENALNPDDISYLLDLKNKNPEAIKRLLKESGINPLDINMEEESTYKPTDRTVSDKEMVFRDTLSQLESYPEGKATIQHINDKWDTESKQALWANPELISVIQTQRENGVYDQIAAEIDRQKLLGQIPSNKPFLEAYKIAGDFLVANNGFKPPEGVAPTTTKQTPAQPAPQPKVLDRRAATPPVDASAERARAASPPQPSSKRAETKTNPLAMADDEFLKNFSL